MKIHEVIKRLQDNYSPDDDIVVAWWDYNFTIQELGLSVEEAKRKLSKDDFSDLAEDIEHYTDWNLVSEYFSDIYENWKEE